MSKRSFIENQRRREIEIEKGGILCPFSNCILNAEHKGLCQFENIQVKRTEKKTYCKFKQNIKRTTPIKYPLGSRVEAKYGTLPKELWWKGNIVCVHRDDTYDILYDDGDFEETKSDNRICLLNEEQLNNDEIDMSEDEIDGFIIISSKKHK